MGDNDDKITIDRKIAIAAIFGTILASVVGALIGGWYVNQGAIDQWNREISFDRQGAAEQFFIEITSMNDTISPYASAYSQNKDVMCKGYNVNVDPNKTAILLFGGNNRPYELAF